MLIRENLCGHPLHDTFQEWLHKTSLHPTITPTISHIKNSRRQTKDLSSSKIILMCVFSCTMRHCNDPIVYLAELNLNLTGWSVCAIIHFESIKIGVMNFRSKNEPYAKQEMICSIQILLFFYVFLEMLFSNWENTILKFVKEKQWCIMTHLACTFWRRYLRLV